MTEINLKCLNKRQIIGILFFSIMFLTIFIRVFALLNSDNFHGIAAGKVFAAQRLIKHPLDLESWIIPAHGPIHMYMVALALKLFGNPLFVPRLISLLAGIAFVAVYYYFIKEAFDEKIALLSSFVISISPLHIVHSIISTAQTSFLFFMILGLFFMERYLKKRNDTHLIYSAVLLSVASMCRFEGGLFIMAVSLFLIKWPKKFFLFLTISSILPVIWMIFNYIYGGNPLFFLSASDSIVHTEFQYLRSLGQSVTLSRKLFFWPAQLCEYFGWPIFLVGLLGLLIWGYKENKRILYLLIMLISFFAFKTVKEELAMQPRYGLSLGILFVPFFALAGFKFIKYISSKKRIIIIIGLFLYILIRGAYLTVLSLPHTPSWLIQAGSFLNENLKDEDAVFIDSEEDNYKEPLKLQANTDGDRFVDHNYSSSHTELIDPFGRAHLKYVVLISKRKMKNLKEVFRAGDCKIYDVKN